MKKSEKLKCRIQDKQTHDKRSINEKLTLIEGLVSHIIDNDLAHIWTVLKALLAGMVALFGAMILKTFFN